MRKNLKSHSKDRFFNQQRSF